MMTMIKRSFFLVFLFAFISFGAVHAYGFLSFGEDKYELVNHKAIYDFELIRLKKASQLADIKGVMNFSWEKDCEGWSTSQNYKMNYYYAGGQKIFLETELASWESKEGDLYRFFVKNNKNNWDILNELMVLCGGIQWGPSFNGNDDTSELYEEVMNELDNVQNYWLNEEYSYYAEKGLVSDIDLEFIGY